MTLAEGAEQLDQYRKALTGGGVSTSMGVGRSFFFYYGVAILLIGLIIVRLSRLLKGGGGISTAIAPLIDAAGWITIGLGALWTAIVFLSG